MSVAVWRFSVERILHVLAPLKNEHVLGPRRALFLLEQTNKRDASPSSAHLYSCAVRGAGDRTV